ncbi:MAG: class I SAM-dependent rRNA methyltransferase [Planctomycetota bacterium]
MSSTTFPPATSVRLKPHRQHPFLARHPWVHAHALGQDTKDLECGQTVDLVDSEDRFIARGLINPASKLRVRLHSFDQDQDLNQDFWCSRIKNAIARRRLDQTWDGKSPDSAERLVFSESDLISGLIVDRYAGRLSIQFTSAALWAHGEAVLSALDDALRFHGIDIAGSVVRLDPKTASHEGCSPVDERRGTMGDEAVLYRIGELNHEVDLQDGQKTGGYLDQRENHRIVAGYLAGRDVLDMCCYHGGFGLSALAAGAKSVHFVDTSAAAIESAKRSMQQNGLSGGTFEVADCFDWLSGSEDQPSTQELRQFDAIILDPPRFAGSRKQVDSAIRAYTRLNRHALDRLRPGGILVTCSCSGRVSRSDFLNMLLDAARRNHRDLVILENRGPAADHPFSICCPESNYLKCVIAIAG